MIDHNWTTRRAESKTSNPERLPFLGNFTASENNYLQFVTHSMDVLRRLDFWDRSAWPLCRHYKAWMDHLEKGIAALPDPPDSWFLTHPCSRIMDLESVRQCGYGEWIAQEILQLWEGMSGMGRFYEEICREWGLPTHLSQMMR